MELLSFMGVFRFRPLDSVYSTKNITFTSNRIGTFSPVISSIQSDLVARKGNSKPKIESVRTEIT